MEIWKLNQRTDSLGLVTAGRCYCIWIVHPTTKHTARFNFILMFSFQLIFLNLEQQQKHNLVDPILSPQRPHQDLGFGVLIDFHCFLFFGFFAKWSQQGWGSRHKTWDMLLPNQKIFTFERSLWPELGSTLSNPPKKSCQTPPLPFWHCQDFESFLQATPPLLIF